MGQPLPASHHPPESAGGFCRPALAGFKAGVLQVNTESEEQTLGGAAISSVHGASGTRAAHWLGSCLNEQVIRVSNQMLYLHCIWAYPQSQGIQMLPLFLTDVAISPLLFQLEQNLDPLLPRSRGHGGVWSAGWWTSPPHYLGNVFT